MYTFQTSRRGNSVSTVTPVVAYVTQADRRAAPRRADEASRSDTFEQ